MKLVVTTPFATYQRGDEITDQAQIDAVLACEQTQFVVKVQVADAAPAPKGKAAPQG